MGYDFVDGFYLILFVYNVFGLCIIVLGICGNEDVEEKLFYLFDLVYFYFLNFNIKVKFKIENIFG